MLRYWLVTVLYAIVLLLVLFFVFTDKIHFFWFVPIVLLYFVSVGLGAFFIQSGFYVSSYCRSKTSEKIVGISFDDGPVENTGKILQVLKDYQATASFFFIGENVEQLPGMVEKVFNAGCVIGNHAYHHKYYFPLQSPKSISAEIEKANDAVFQVINKKIRFFRPPFGVTNPMVAKGIKKSGMISVGWSIRSLDTAIKDEKRIIKRITKKIKPGKIILLHSSTKNIEVILDKLLEWLVEHNYKTVSLDKMINEKWHD